MRKTRAILRLHFESHLIPGQIASICKDGNAQEGMGRNSPAPRSAIKEGWMIWLAEEADYPAPRHRTEPLIGVLSERRTSNETPHPQRSSPSTWRNMTTHFHPGSPFSTVPGFAS